MPPDKRPKRRKSYSIRAALRGVVLFLGLLPGIASADLPEIRAAGELRVCLAVIDADLTAPPDPGCETCEWSGLIPDQVRVFADELGVAARFIRVRWAEQFQDAQGLIEPVSGQTPALLQGPCDLYASNLAQLEWREQLIDIVPLFQNRMLVLTRPEQAEQITGPRDLAGLRVTVARRSSFHTWITELNDGLLAEAPIRLNHDGDGGDLQDLAEGRSDFAVTDADMAVMSVRNRYPDLHVAFAAGPVQNLGWGLSKESTALRVAIEAFFATQTSDSASDLNQIWRRQLGLSIPEFEALVRALPGG